MRHCTTDRVALHKIDMIWELSAGSPKKGAPVTRFTVIHVDVPGILPPAFFRGHTYFTPLRRTQIMANTDPFSVLRYPV